MNFQASDVRRRLASLINIGRVAELDAEGARVRVEIGQILTHWLPWVAGKAGADAAWHPPDPGEQVLVLAPAGELAQAVVLAGLYQDRHPAPGNSPEVCIMAFSDGAVLSYDKAVHALSATLPEGGTVSITSPGGVTVSAEGGVNVTGDITVNGNLSVSGNVQAGGDVEDGHATMAADRAVYNSHTHTGNAGAPTSPPAQTQ